MTKTIIKTVDYCINYGIKFLKKSNNIDHDNIVSDSIILVAYILKKDIKELFLILDYPISDSQFNELNKLLFLRRSGQPVYKIIGEKPFFKHHFITNNDVLDPRSDTEILVESIIAEYKNYKQNINFLELGVGSGCVILSVMSILINSVGYAIDISDKAIKTSKNNALKLQLDNKVHFICKDWNNLTKSDFTDRYAFDCIISNPPYIKTLDIYKLSNEVKNFDPKIALDGGEDGLKCYREIANIIKKKNIPLKENAKIFLEIGKNQENEVRNIFNLHGFKTIRSQNDLNNIERVLVFSV